MTKFLVSIHRPNDYDPLVSENEEMTREISSLNAEMVAAGIRVFVGGLPLINNAKSLRIQTNGEVHITDEQYLKTTEHVGGFWVLEVSNLDEALVWGRKAAIACRAHVEVRPFH